MGTWGSGNFDSDGAADHLAMVTDRLIAEVKEAMDGDPVGLEPDEYWGVAIPCNLELLGLIAQQGYVGALLPDAATIDAWKTKFLSIWDATIDDLEPTDDYKTERRAVLIRTFDRLTEATTDLAD
ncbi:DUF4259 domain-containing protein [Yinghuangia sp. ASG 101]|uniref:DUF4259 domain-containing protein n=1 Tax=Yinghuangia sp. ASG 101 TaxID=2896848 RepID=UPI001E3362F9|nr:DUF4259 domain-containing protein [Yinghuangia sp. ASG 101]UGQ14305.1 DUF4259 domain-containing protein [Yinghuangia sp. ASG 101]